MAPPASNDAPTPPSHPLHSVAEAIAARGAFFAVTPTADQRIAFQLRPPSLTHSQSEVHSFNDAVHCSASSQLAKTNTTTTAAAAKAPPAAPAAAAPAAAPAAPASGILIVHPTTGEATRCELRYREETSSFEVRLENQDKPVSGRVAFTKTLDQLEKIALDQCVARHLTEGGDDRLHINPVTGGNKYYCKPYPAESATLLRSSCTCSPPTAEGFEAAKKLLQQVWYGELTEMQAFANTRERILLSLGLSTRRNRVILHPSGSDAELIPLLVACARAEKMGCTSVVNIVTAAGEVGSGTAPAAGGRHFSDFAPLGTVIKNMGLVESFPKEKIKVVELKPRETDGSLRRNYDQLVREAISHQLAVDPKTMFVLHAVDGSKTGLRVPSSQLVSQVAESLGDRVVVVLDACQLRSKREELQLFLDLQAIILVTSSKFFHAPGFCGAAIVPDEIAEELAVCEHIPSGMADYLTKLEVPPSIKALHRALPTGPTNLGLLLRWACGLVEMEAFAKVNGTCEAATRWVEGARNVAAKYRPHIVLLDERNSNCAGDSPTRIGQCNTIVAVKCRHPVESRYLSFDELKEVHKQMVKKKSSIFLPPRATPEELRAVDYSCFIGQPVKLGVDGVLRLALSAPLARRIAQSPSILQKALGEDDKILRKMSILVKYLAEQPARL